MVNRSKVASVVHREGSSFPLYSGGNQNVSCYDDMLVVVNDFCDVSFVMEFSLL